MTEFQMWSGLADQYRKDISHLSDERKAALSAGDIKRAYALLAKQQRVQDKCIRVLDKLLGKMHNGQ